MHESHLQKALPRQVADQAPAIGAQNMPGPPMLFGHCPAQPAEMQVECLHTMIFVEPHGVLSDNTQQISCDSLTCGHCPV